jgi:hypothetical protein
VVINYYVPYKIKPFCSLQGIEFVEKAIKREFTTKWKPILKLMKQYLGFDASTQVDKTFMQSFFATATEHLKTRAEYVWNRVQDDRIFQLMPLGPGDAIWTWSKYVQWSENKKYVTAQDKSNLLEATARNQADRRMWFLILLGMLGQMEGLLLIRLLGAQIGIIWRERLLHLHLRVNLKSSVL